MQPDCRAKTDLRRNGMYNEVVCMADRPDDCCAAAGRLRKQPRMLRRLSKIPMTVSWRQANATGNSWSQAFMNPPSPRLPATVRIWIRRRTLRTTAAGGSRWPVSRVSLQITLRKRRTINALRVREAVVLFNAGQANLARAVFAEVDRSQLGNARDRAIYDSQRTP